MKPLIFCFLLSIFSISGCAFLRGGDEAGLDDSSQEDMSGEFAGGEDEGEAVAEESSDESGDFEESEEDEEEFVAEGEEEDMEEEESEGGGLRGFFSRIFSSDEEEESLDGEEGDFVDEGSGYAEDSETYEDYPDEEYAGADEALAPEDQEAPDESKPAMAEAGAASPPEPPASEPAKPSFIPLNKIIAVPYKKAGYLVNAVYIARPGDTLESLSQKIYGSDQSGALRRVNSHLQARALKVGDKIYYNSPQRQNDESKLLFYYKDVMAPSASYNLSPGENIRQVAHQLLGHPKSWKEIWATNPGLESKGEITRNISIVYWPADTAVEPQPAPEPVAEEAPAEPEELVSPSADALSADASSPDTPSADTSSDSPLPAPGQEDTAFQPEDFPPPPSPALSQPKDKKIGFLQIIFQQQGLILTLVGIIAALILMIRLILKKRKQKDFDYTATNIEI